MDKIWFYTKGDGEKYGPYTDEELVKLIKQGILSGEDYIWMTELDEWILIQDSIYSFYLEK
ncbi:MAG: DUF4339 domain-containing protein [Solobacterium sp.]|nr:DUF4339 domain-containing protein [Solobacterium sp.]